MTRCQQCGREVVKARVGYVWRAFDAEPSSDGEWATWTSREGLLWVTHAKHQSEGDRLNNSGLRNLHRCEPAGQQLELGGAA